jgi:probable HAF family extracellular repeat protein
MPIYTVNTIFNAIDYPSATNGTVGAGINDSGQIVGFSSGHGFLLSGGQFTTVDRPDSLGTEALGINDLGQIVGSYQHITGGSHPFVGDFAFVYNAGSFTDLAIDPFHSFATGINNSGLIGGYRSFNNADHGFLYSLSDGSYTPIDDPLATPNFFGAGTTHVFGINNAGQAVGDYLMAGSSPGTFVSHGFIYSGGVFTTLDDPLGTNSTQAHGINDQGMIVGSFIDSANVSHGFVYSNGTFTTLDDPLGTHGTAALGINDLGQIVGSFTDSANVTHGFLAVQTLFGPFPDVSRDANQATGRNFIGPGGGSGDMLLIADHNDVRTVEALQIENANLQTSQVIATVGSNVAFDGAGDFNHDGLSDLLAHTDNTGVRSLFAYQMTPVGVGGTSMVANLGADWSSDAFGDFNGDGTSDILLHHDSGATRTFEVLSMNNYAVQSAPIVQVTGVDWGAVGTGDFNHDGTSDILEQRIVDGNVNGQVVTLQNNVVQSVSLFASIGSDWSIDGTGDFNHDGTSDILMHRDSSNGMRTLEVLTIKNNAIQSATVIAQVGTNISVDGIGDFNSDGTSDIALHQDVGTTRTDLIYNVVNNTVVNPHTVAVTGIDWHVS